MKVTNLTQNTYVLSGGVKLTPGVVDFVIADELFQSDSTLNIALGQMEFRGLISTDEVPDDPFPPKGTGLFTYIQTEPPSDQGDGDTWLRLANGYPDLFGAGLYTWFNGQWNATAPATLDESGVVSGIVSVGPDGNIVLEHFDPDSNATGVFIGPGQVYFFLSNDSSEGSISVDTTTFEMRENMLLSAQRALFQGTVTEAVSVTINASPNQSGNMLETYDDQGNLRFFVDPQGNLTIQNENGYAFMQTASDGSFGASNGGFYAASDNGYIELDDAGFDTMFVADKGGVRIVQHADTHEALSVRGLNEGTKDLLYVEDGNGDPVLRVEADGTVHIKTGGTIHADL